MLDKKGDNQPYSRLAMSLGRLLRKFLKAIKMSRQIFPASHYLLLSMLFAVGLELIFALQRWVVLVAIIVVAVMTIGVFIVKAEEKGRFRPTYVILPILATVGLSGFAFFLPTNSLLHLYILAASFIMFFLLSHASRQAYPIWNWTISLFVYFLNIAFILGLRFHLYVPIMLVLIATMTVTSLMLLQALRRIVPTISDAIIPVMGMSLVLTELVWVLQFLPSHYLVQASLTTSLYYVIFNLVSLSYTRKLNRRDLIEYIGVGLTASLIIVLTAQWV